ncbi:MAG: serine/threonine protein kinase [Methylophilales bacterium]|nr:serine/threonine protein kinase [Methylophilales bacterium]
MKRMNPANHPFSELVPDTILTALENIGLRCDGHLLALNSYENRVYQVGIEENPPLVAKFYRPERWSDDAILEEHAFTQELADREIPVVPPLVIDSTTLHHALGFRFAVFPKQGGRAPELGNPDTLEWMGRFLGRIHAVGALQSFKHRPTLDIKNFGEESRDYLLQHNFIPPDLLEPWQSIVAQALDGVRAAFDRAGDVTKIRLHGDCHAGNVLWTDAADYSGPHFVDFDDSRMGPAVQDLWMLLSGERGDQTRQLSDVLAGYEDFCEFHPRELHLIEALRTLRLIHYSAWLARRWDDPAFPMAFPWFNTQHYWQDRVLELREQVALMQEPPLQA